MSVEETINNAVANLTTALTTELRTGFADTGARIDQTNARLDQTNAKLDQTNARLDQTNVRLDNFHQEVTIKLDGIASFLLASEKNQARVEARLINLEERVENLEQKQKPA